MNHVKVMYIWNDLTFIPFAYDYDSVKLQKKSKVHSI